MLRPAVLALLAGALLLPAGASAAPGDPDPVFGDDGTVHLSRGAGVEATFPAADGATLLVANADPATEDGPSSVAIARLTRRGALDESFGTGGVVRLPEAVGTSAVEAVQLPDGDLVVLADGVSDSTGYPAYTLSRVNPDGTLDDAFGENGIVTGVYADFDTPPADTTTSYSASASALTVLGADRIAVGVLLATSTQFSWTRRAAVAVYDVEGGPDTAFGQSGHTILPTSDRTGPADLAAAPGGKLLVVGDSWTGPTRPWLARLDTDGELDDAFGDHGIAPVTLRDTSAPDETALYEGAETVVALPDGDALVGGSTSVENGELATHGVITRLDAEGDVVPSFGTVGRLVLGGADDIVSLDELLLADGAVLGAGTFQAKTDSGYDRPEPMTIALDGDGLDAGFGDAGISTAGDFGWGTIESLTLDDDGFATLAGTPVSPRGWTVIRVDTAAARTPVNDVAPELAPRSWGSGEPIPVGEDLSTTPGTWFYGTVTRQWQRCGTSHPAERPAVSSCTDIDGAHDTTYTLTAVDGGKHVRVVETGTSDAGTLAVATRTFAVETPTEPPAFTSDVTISPAGTVPVGTTLHAAFAFTGTPPITAEVTWYACPTAAGGTTTAPCQPRMGEDLTDDAYTTTADDAGRFMRAIVQLYGSPGYASEQSTDTVAVVAADGPEPAAPTATSAPTITPTGTAEVGTTLTRTGDGAWDQDDLTFGYRWERCAVDGSACAAIGGAAGASYATTAADVGHAVRMVVEARHGSGPVGTARSAATPITATPAPPADPGSPHGGGGPAAPAAPAPAPTPAPALTIKGLKSVLAVMDSTTSVPMPEVRGLPVDQARAKIAAAGIHAALDVVETVRSKPLKLGGKALDVGDVSAQSLSAGTPVVSSVGTPKPIRLAAEAGPKASVANGGASGPACTGRDVRADLVKVELDDVLDLLAAKRCTKLDLDFTVSRSARQLEVRKAAKEGGKLALTVVVPGDPANMDLTVALRQGAFTSAAPFGRDDWALTADADNIFGVQAINRAGVTVDGVDVLVDGSDVGVADRRAKAPSGGILPVGLRPTKTGVVNVLVQQTDAKGNSVFGFARFKVVKRTAPFRGIDSRWYDAQGEPTTAPRATARAAGWNELLGALQNLAASLGGSVANLFRGGASEQTITTAAKQKTGSIVQLALGDVLSGRAGVVAAGGANVVAAGGGNVVAAGGGNVVAAGGGNLVSLASGAVVAAGGGNLIGREHIANGTGQLLGIPANVVAAGGANVVAAGGGNVIAAGGGNVVAAGGGNVVAAGGGN